METAPGCDFYKLMIGIGVNLNTESHHYQDVHIATSVLMETGIHISIDEFSTSLLNNFIRLFEVLKSSEGFSGTIYHTLNERMYLKGKKVKIFDRNLINVTLEGTFHGLNPDGTVIIIDNQGVRHTINDGRMREYDFKP